MATPDGPLQGDALLAAVTDAMVALHERHYHRPPGTAKTRMMGDDLLACVLGGVYTDVEKTLIELERDPIVRDNRSAFQIAMETASSRPSSGSPAAASCTSSPATTSGPTSRSSCSSSPIPYSDSTSRPPGPLRRKGVGTPPTQRRASVSVHRRVSANAATGEAIGRRLRRSCDVAC